jgi:hypothetical protein
VLKHGHFGKWIKSTLIILKCDAGEGWRRSVGLIVPKCITYSQGAKKNTTDRRKAKWIDNI